MPIPPPSAPSVPAPHAPADKPAGVSPAFIPGLVLLILAAASSGALVMAKLGGITLPGCGGASACDEAAKSPWGFVPPKIEWFTAHGWPDAAFWPVSFLGFAYFVAMLVAWVVVMGKAPAGMRTVARLGAVASVYFIGIMLYTHVFCKYCIASHVCNLLFLPLALTGAKCGAGACRIRGLAAGAAVFAVASIGLGVAEQRATQKANDEYANSVRQMVQATKAGQPAPTGPAGSSGASAASGAAGATAASPATGARGVQRPGFTGRWRFGPERAAIRVVMITDYGCPDCKNLEGQMRQILSQRNDTSLSIKHFPFCTDCNKTPNVPNLHPNSCWAARAAETAGMLYGQEGFQKMHVWLFEHSGAFTDEVLKQGLDSLGFDKARFIQFMTSDAPLKGIQADIAEAAKLGIQRTPMVFINGVELKNWNVDPQALPKAVQEVADAHPRPLGPEADQPPPASDKYVEDWWDPKNPAMAWPQRAKTWSTADPNAPVKIEMFGDFLEPNCAQADQTIRDACAGRADIHYEFRYFPIDQSCNAVPNNMFPGGCRAARAAEAAGQLGGPDAYWAMHIWLMTHQQQLKAAPGADPIATIDAAVRAAAPGMGLDPGALITKMDSPDVAQIVSSDANIGYRIGIPEIPRIFVNGKLVPRWNLPGGFVLERIIERATAKSGKKD